MATFRFRLEFLLDLKKRLEEEAAARQAKRLASIRELEGKIAAIEDRRTSLSTELTRKSEVGEVTPALLSLYSDYQVKLLQDLKKADELLLLSRRELAKEQAALRKALVERQLMEKIKEKKAEAFKAEELYKEQNTLEELASLMKARKIRMNSDAS
ncbi:MAG: flagellar export protein FliJ [Deltaproteobacteria bacterium]|nr:flagellar export protein FliJ [Deltaproteobacteria bacterium]